MKRFSKIVIFLLIFNLFILIPIVKASTVNMDLSTNTAGNGTSEVVTQASKTNNTATNQLSTSSNSSNPLVTRSNSDNQEFLTTENILSITIIVIGIILIFLGIAIIIRCK